MWICLSTGPLAKYRPIVGGVGLGLAALVVVDLEEDVGAGRQCPRRALGRSSGHPTRRPAPELAGGEERAGRWGAGHTRRPTSRSPGPGRPRPASGRSR